MQLKAAFINLIYANLAMILGAALQTVSSYLPTALTVVTFAVAMQAYLVAVMFAVDAGAHVADQVRRLRGKRDA